MQGQPVSNLTDVTNYFYKLDRAGLGKNHIATYVHPLSVLISLNTYLVPLVG